MNRILIAFEPACLDSAHDGFRNIYYIDGNSSELEGEIPVFNVREVERYLHFRAVLPNPPIIVKISAIVDIDRDQ